MWRVKGIAAASLKERRIPCLKQLRQLVNGHSARLWLFPGSEEARRQSADRDDRISVAETRPHRVQIVQLIPNCYDASKLITVEGATGRSSAIRVTHDLDKLLFIVIS